MKFLSAFKSSALAAVALLSVEARTSCDDGVPSVTPTLTPTPTPTPTPTTATPAPTPEEDPTIKFIGSDGGVVYTMGIRPDKCTGWQGCFRRDLAKITWPALPFAGIRVYSTARCEGEFYDFYRGVAPGATSGDASQYKSFVVVTIPEGIDDSTVIDRSDAFGCQK